MSRSSVYNLPGSFKSILPSPQVSMGESPSESHRSSMDSGVRKTSTTLSSSSQPRSLPQTSVGLDHGVKPIIYRSQEMTQLMKVVDRVAPTTANIIILGESGTGKELIARAIHDLSDRAHQAFVAINCGALRDTLLESELFGHEKGSFTGAIQKKIGLAEMADGGTLFLDEIGELAPSIQTKLLRFLQEGEFYRVGGKEAFHVNIRLICATHRDIDQEVQKGHFREDLYYRINTISLEVPPLRRRTGDIPLLIQHFLSQKTRGKGEVNLAKNLEGLEMGSKKVDPEAMDLLLKYQWPGNIRELENLCERWTVLCSSPHITKEDVPDNIRNPKVADQLANGPQYDPQVSLAHLERDYIIKAVRHFKGNKSKAAGALGVTIKTLYNRLHEYGMFHEFSLHSNKPGGGSEPRASNGFEGLDGSEILEVTGGDEEN